MSSKNARMILMPLLLALSLSGCATNSPPLVVKPAQVPPPPAELMQELDLSESYSDIVRRLLLDWHKRLTDWKASS